jgi:hypothetical protein
MLIVDVLKEAKELLSELNGEIGMCFCIIWICNCNDLKYTSLYYIRKNIPEFNSLYLTGINKSMGEYWWDPEDKQSRLKAFDELINLYNNSNKQWI